MSIYHLTQSQGRADSLYIEAQSKNKLLTFLETVSTAITRNIKKVVYSKPYNINYTNKNAFVREKVYHKVVIFAMTKNYAQTFTLFNVKKTVTKEIIEEQYRKLFINDEPIIDFFNIDFYNSSDVYIDTDNLYQIQYKRDSKTYIENMYASSWQSAKDIFDTLISGELIEIRAFEYYSSAILRDDGNYFPRVNFYISDSSSKMSLSIPKVKKTIKHDELVKLVKDTVLFKGKKITNEKITVSYR